MDTNLHTLLVFQGERCESNPVVEVAPTSACVYSLKSKQIEFQRSDDLVSSTALVCEIAVLKQQNNDYYNLKIHCQKGKDHIEFTIPHTFFAFEDDELPPDTPEEFVTMITETESVLTGEAEEETNVAVVTPAVLLMKTLLVHLENSKKSAFSSPIRLIHNTKLHHNFGSRILCVPRVNEIQMLIESKQIDFNNIIFHVVNHPTIPDNYEIAKGNHSFAAYLQLKASRKPVPSTLKCKVYERKENYGIFEIALTAGQVIKGSSYSYMEKVVAMRVTLEKNQISREIATKTKSTVLKTLYNFLFPSENFPKSCSFLLGLPNEIFETCLNTSYKFTNGEICYSTNKPPEYCPLPYKTENLRYLNPESFWAAFSRSYRQNSIFTMDIINKLSLSFGIEDALKEFKTTVSDFNQQLLNSGIQYAGTFEDAKAAFGLPSGINEDQAHFLLSNRFIQKQLTRKPNFDINAAKLNILAFLKSVDNVQFEHFEDASSLDGFQLIFSFAEVDWEHTELPKHCLILDFCSSNDEFLGQDIPIAWKFMVITKNVQTPVNGKLPLITSPLRLYWHSDGPDGDDGSYARTILQTKAEEKSIKLGNVFDVNNIGTLFKFCDNESSVILIEPPIEYIDILISSLMEEIKKLSKLTVIASNSDKAKRFQSKLSNFITEKWKKKAEEGRILTTPKKATKRNLSTKNKPPDSAPATSSNATPATSSNPTPATSSNPTPPTAQRQSQ